jgi:hypothetical protein
VSGGLYSLSVFGTAEIGVYLFLFFIFCSVDVFMLDGVEYNVSIFFLHLTLFLGWTLFLNTGSIVE